MGYKLQDYKCNACQQVTEFFLGRDEPPICPCGSTNLTVYLSRGSTKGIDGWAFKDQILDIDVQPIRVTNKAQLKKELDKRKLRSFYTHG